MIMCDLDLRKDKHVHYTSSHDCEHFCNFLLFVQKAQSGQNIVNRRTYNQVHNNKYTEGQVSKDIFFNHITIRITAASKSHFLLRL
jgi:hypothetical protein